MRTRKHGTGVSGRWVVALVGALIGAAVVGCRGVRGAAHDGAGRARRA